MHQIAAAIVAAGWPIVRRPTRQIRSPATTSSANGTARRARMLEPSAAKTGAVRNTSCVPPYSWCQKNVGNSPSRTCRTMRPQTASSESGAPRRTRSTRLVARLRRTRRREARPLATPACATHERRHERCSSTAPKVDGEPRHGAGVLRRCEEIACASLIGLVDEKLPPGGTAPLRACAGCPGAAHARARPESRARRGCATFPMWHSALVIAGRPERALPIGAGLARHGRHRKRARSATRRQGALCRSALAVRR